MHPAIMRYFKKPNRAFIATREFPLPELDADAGGRSFADVVHRRRSFHDFTGAPMSLQELSTLLKLGMGETGALHNGQARRAYASGGAMFINDLYIMVRSVDGLPPGLYHFNVQRHFLELVSEGALDLNDYFYDQSRQGGVERASLENCAAALVMVAFLRKAGYKYGERAWKLALLEAGHIGQNFYLATAALDDVGINSVGGCKELELRGLLPIDARSEAILYAQIVGKA
ncbi:MAG TPA: SagB/ThcOx family dehydrogenase [Candidatus Baltobacteraceae bacterium]|nr:SagB/ThcOx family dehydrogenase [Candidatus Baltobacteraceae bacterium]